MRFLVEQCLSAYFASALTEAGHDVTHLRDIGMQRAKDPEVLDRDRARALTGRNELGVLAKGARTRGHILSGHGVLVKPAAAARS
ncbi:MAG: DUF5615 family PIN-like protein [Acidimicrobiales bacterium]